jgi:hypothetical protein
MSDYHDLHVIQPDLEEAAAYGVAHHQQQHHRHHHHLRYKSPDEGSPEADEVIDSGLEEGETVVHLDDLGGGRGGGGSAAKKRKTVEEDEEEDNDPSTSGRRKIQIRFIEDKVSSCLSRLG